MPYSDNLYSANDEAEDNEDNESFSNELSPTDGFFNRSPMSPNHMVPDPSLDRKDAAEEDKVLIPRSETRNQSGSASRSTASPTLGQLFPSQNYASSQSNNRPAASSSTSNTPSSPSSHRRNDNNIFSAPSHSMQGPPPAYTPSSPTTSSHTPSAHNRSYSTFDEPHRVEPGPPSNTEPQSMGRPSEDPNEYTPLSNIQTPRKPSRRRLFITKLLFVALVIVVAMSIMTMLVNWGQSISKKDPQTPGGKLPDGTKPPDLGLPDAPSNAPYCPSASYHNGEIFFDFAIDKGLTLRQETHEGERGSGSHSVRITGEIRLRKLPKNSKYAGRGLFSIDTHMSPELEDLQILKTWDDELRVMKISVPRTFPYSSGRDSCVSLEITVWLPEEILLSDLTIESTSLTLRVFEDINFKVAGRTGFLSLSGDVIFPEPGKGDAVPPTSYPLDSRHITVETVSGDIKGIYPLYDYLKLGSQSGSITAGVLPQSVLASAPAPADLEVSTSSGDIKVNCLFTEIPRYTPIARDYVTRVLTVSGEISGGYYLGSIGSFKTSSGDIKAKVLPVIQYSPSTDPDDAPKTQFDTWSVSGDHEIEMLDPVFISLLPTDKEIQPTHPVLPVKPEEPNEPDESDQPGQHHSEPPYKDIGDNDPYKDILPPTLNEDIILEQDNNKMTKRRRTATKKWRTLTSTHHSSSADISVSYPVAWEGTVSEKTVSGDVKVDGKDLKIMSYKKGWAYRELVAGKGVSRKGEGSSVVMDVISGDLTFKVGEI